MASEGLFFFFFFSWCDKKKTFYFHVTTRPWKTNVDQRSEVYPVKTFFPEFILLSCNLYAMKCADKCIIWWVLTTAYTPVTHISTFLSRYRTFHLPWKISSCLYSVNPSTLKKTTVLFSINIALSKTSYKWKHMVRTILCLIYFTHHSVLWLIYVVAHISNSFFFIAQWYSIVWIDHNLYLNSPAGGH